MPARDSSECRRSKGEGGSFFYHITVSLNEPTEHFRNVSGLNRWARVVRKHLAAGEVPDAAAFARLDAVELVQVYAAVLTSLKSTASEARNQLARRRENTKYTKKGKVRLTPARLKARAWLARIAEEEVDGSLADVSAVAEVMIDPCLTTKKNNARHVRFDSNLKISRPMSSHLVAVALALGIGPGGFG